MAVAAALALGAAIGAVTGVIVAKGRVQAFIATLVMMLLRGVTMVYTNGSPVNTGFAPNARSVWLVTGIGRPLGVPTPVWMIGIVFPRGLVHAASHASGRYVYALGGDEAATRLSGAQRTIKSKSWSILFVSLLASLAGIIEVARLSSAQHHGGDWL
ncbi:ABC transporter permease subunit [Shigella flexneri]